MHTFKKADRVCHKLGGPVMMVHTVFNPPMIGCEWWVGQELRRENFEVEVLVLEEAGEDERLSVAERPRKLYGRS